MDRDVPGWSSCTVDNVPSPSTHRAGKTGWHSRFRYCAAQDKWPSPRAAPGDHERQAQNPPAPETVVPDGKHDERHLQVTQPVERTIPLPAAIRVRVGIPKEQTASPDDNTLAAVRILEVLVLEQRMGMPQRPLGAPGDTVEQVPQRDRKEVVAGVFRAECGDVIERPRNRGTVGGKEGLRAGSWPRDVPLIMLV